MNSCTQQNIREDWCKYSKKKIENKDRNKWKEDSWKSLKEIKIKEIDQRILLKVVVAKNQIEILVKNLIKVQYKKVKDN